MKTLLAALMLLVSLPASAQPIGPDKAVRDALAWSEDYQWAADITSTAMVAAALATACLDDRTWACVGDEAADVTVTLGVKWLVNQLVHRERPNGYDRKSFYSLHTTLACIGARGKLLALCPATAYLRMAANWHWLTDVAPAIVIGRETRILIHIRF